MKVGTKSLLFGVHQFAWHPVTVWIAWVVLYRSLPSFRETVCIIVHDWGYWGAPEMDGPVGTQHPETGAKIAGFLFGPAYYDLVLNHSRQLAKQRGATPSRLCWADKFSMIYDPSTFYLVRARLTGELREYRLRAAHSDFVPLMASNRAWHRKLVSHAQALARKKAAELRA